MSYVGVKIHKSLSISKKIFLSHKNLVYILMALSLIISMSFPLQKAFADPNLIVTSNADDGTSIPANCPSESDCRLRDAIAKADNDEHITFDLNLAGAIINLSSTLTLSKNVF